MTAQRSPSDFESQARAGRTSLLREVIGLLRENRKWWLIPVFVMVLVLGALVILSGTAAAPFIYTLF